MSIGESGLNLFKFDHHASLRGIYFLDLPILCHYRKISNFGDANQNGLRKPHKIVFFLLFKLNEPQNISNIMSFPFFSLPIKTKKRKGDYLFMVCDYRFFAQLIHLKMLSHFFMFMSDIYV